METKELVKNKIVDNPKCIWVILCCSFLLTVLCWQFLESAVEARSRIVSIAFLIGGLLINLLLYLFAREIINYRKAKSELMEQQDQLDQFFKYAEDMLCVADINGYFRKVNPSFERELGYSKEELLSRPFIEFVHPEDRELTLAELDKLALGIPTLEFHNRYQKKDGSYIYLSWATGPTLDGRLYAVARNTTKQVELEKSLLEAKNNAILTSKSKSEFVANMSHEIRTPLNSIIGVADLLDETPLNDEQKKFLEILKKSGENLLSIINDILSLSKIESGYLQIDISEFNINDVIKETYEMILPKALKKKIKFLYSVDSKVAQNYQGDVLKLKQILLNLLSNAVKFTDEGVVSLRVELNEDPQCTGNLKFIIKDSGIGVDKDKQSSLFQMFSQVDSSITKKYGGTGLGLVICKKLVEIFNGKIWFESEKNKGSTFFFTIQFAEGLTERAGLNHDDNKNDDNKLTGEKFQEFDKAEPVGPAEKAEPTKNEHLDILLVDDLSENRLLIRTYLKSKDYNIIEAENGERAIDLVKNNKFDLILMDMQMPILDGFATTEAIREWEAQHCLVPTPIVAVTAYALDEEKAKCLWAGCNTHVSKPVKKQTLIQTIETLVG